MVCLHMTAVHNPLYLCSGKQLTPMAVSLDLDFSFSLGVEKGRGEGAMKAEVTSIRDAEG